jgi:hypothetical protein
MASAADAVIAAHVAAGQTNLVSDEIDERLPDRHARFDRISIDGAGNLGAGLVISIHD